MSNLPDALIETCSVLAELENVRASGVRALRARVDLMTTASVELQLLPESHNERLAFSELAREIRDEAVKLRQRHRVLWHSIVTMMD
jgi:hypothetical protein